MRRAGKLPLLILTRKVGESLIIGDQIRVQVLGLRGKQVRLGVEAPEEVVVLREEIFQRLARENLQAAAWEMAALEVLAAAVREAAKPGSIPPPLFPAPPEGATLEVASKHLAQFLVAPEQVFTFSPGLAGFPQWRRLALVEHPRVAPFLWLQSLEDPDLALAAAEPKRIGADLPDPKPLAGESPAGLLVLVLLTAPPARPQEAAANLGAPLVLNRETRMARQVVRENSQHSHEHRVLPPAKSKT